MRTKKIKSLVWGIERQKRLTVGENNITNIVKRGEYPQNVDYVVYETGRRTPRIISGLRIDKIEFFEE